MLTVSTVMSTPEAVDYKALANTLAEKSSSASLESSVEATSIAPYCAEILQQFKDQYWTSIQQQLTLSGSVETLKKLQAENTYPKVSPLT